MFPHTITIFTYQEDTDTYTKQVIEGVWWSSSDSVPIATERAHNGSGRVVIPKELMGNILVAHGSYVVKGEHDDITSSSELENVTCFQVSDIKVNDAGWDIDNMVISGN